MEIGGNHIQHGLFPVGQIVAAGLEHILPRFSGGPANDHQRHVAAQGGSRHVLSLQGHFGIAHGPVGPVALIGHVPGPAAPGLILGGQNAVHLHPMLQQPLHQVTPVGGHHVAAAAVAHGEVIHRAPAKHRNPGLPGNGQGLVLIFQQHDAVRRHGPGLRGNLRHRQPAAPLRPIQVLLQPRPVNPAEHKPRRLIE